MIGVEWKHLMHMLSLSTEIYPKSYVGLGSNRCLAMLNYGRSHVISCHLRDIGGYLPWLAISAIVEYNHEVMNKWRPGGIWCLESSKAWRSCLHFLSLLVSIKDHIIGGHMIILNTFLSLSRPNNSFRPRSRVAQLRPGTVGVGCILEVVRMCGEPLA